MSLDGLARNLESVLVANEPELTPAPKKLAGDVEGLIVGCTETVKAIAWRFARSTSDGRIDVDDLFSIGMLEICEALAAGRSLAVNNPVAYLCGVARLAMCEEWRRVHEWSTASLDAPLSDDDSQCLADIVPSPAVVAPAAVASKRARALHSAMRRLGSKRQRAVLRRLYGLDGHGRGGSNREIGRSLGLEKSCVCSYVTKGRHALRADARLRKVVGVEVQA